MSRLIAVVVACVLLAGCVTLAPTASPTPTSSRTPTASVSPSAMPTSQTQSPPTPVNTHAGPTREPTASGSGGPPTPGASIDPAVAGQIDAVVASVPALRGLESLSDVPYEFQSREQFTADLIEIAFAEVPEEIRHAEERMLKRLGLIPQEANLDQLYIDLYGAGVLAYYRDDTKRFYIIESGKPFGPGDKVTVAHEYVHALQDQHFDLTGTRIDDLSQGDAALGQLGAIEGDATLTMQLWAQANLTEIELLEYLFEAIGQVGEIDLDSIPWVLRRQLEFPYSDGYVFTQGIHDAGGFEAVNETIIDPPESTEQILHPEKYRADELPVQAFSPDLTGALGEGWTNAHQQTMGELIMQVFAAGDETPDQPIPGLPVEWAHAETVAGWGGDRLFMYENPNGDWGIVWSTAWDTAADAVEFHGRAQTLQARLGGVSRVATGLPDNGVVILIGSDDGVVGDLEDALASAAGA